MQTNNIAIWRESFVRNSWRRRRCPLVTKGDPFDCRWLKTIVDTLRTGIVRTRQGSSIVVAAMAPIKLTIFIVVRAKFTKQVFLLFTKTPVGPKPQCKKFSVLFVRVVVTNVVVGRFTNR